MANVHHLPPNERTGMESAEAAPRSDWPNHHRSGHYRRGSQFDVAGGVFWAALFIMAGTVFLADNLSLLPALGDTWDWIMMGAGGLILFFSFVRAVSPDLSRPGLFWMIAGFVLLGLGAADIFSIDLSDLWWPVILIVIGLGSLARAIRR